MVQKRAAAGELQLSDRRAKLSAEFAKLNEHEADQEVVADVSVVVQFLLTHQDQLKKAKRYILNNFFSPDNGKEAEARFRPPTLYFNKIPGEFLRSALETFNLTTADQARAWDKLDKGSSLKLLCRSCQVAPNGPNYWLLKSEWLEVMGARARSNGKLVIRTLASGAIDWSSTGFYKLLPVFAPPPPPPAEGQQAQAGEPLHKYTSVQAMGKFGAIFVESTRVGA